jgi:hypothetical protein
MHPAEVYVLRGSTSTNLKGTDMPKHMHPAEAYAGVLERKHSSEGQAHKEAHGHHTEAYLVWWNTNFLMQEMHTPKHMHPVEVYEVCGSASTDLKGTHILKHRHPAEAYAGVLERKHSSEGQAHTEAHGHHTEAYLVWWNTSFLMQDMHTPKHMHPAEVYVACGSTSTTEQQNNRTDLNGTHMLKHMHPAEAYAGVLERKHSSEEQAHTEAHGHPTEAYLVWWNTSSLLQDMHTLKHMHSAEVYVVCGSTSTDLKGTHMLKHMHPAEAYAVVRKRKHNCINNCNHNCINNRTAQFWRTGCTYKSTCTLLTHTCDWWNKSSLLQDMHTPKHMHPPEVYVACGSTSTTEQQNNRTDLKGTHMLNHMHPAEAYAGVLERKHSPDGQAHTEAHGHHTEE